jgi:hypothetical protein
MADATGWPNYAVAPSDSVFALGVVSINYARFERAVTWVFAAVSGMSEEYAAIIMARSNASDRAQLIRQMIAKPDWPKDASDSEIAIDLIRHFLKAADILVKNRNFLVHSNMIHGTKDRAALYSTSKKGSTILVERTCDEIRQVADDLNTYFYFGLALANSIAVKVRHADLAAGVVVFHAWPEKPILPNPFQEDTPKPDPH